MQSESQETVKHLCEHAEAELRELREAGITPTLDEVVWINDLSREVENPKGGEKRHLAGAPSKAGDIWLWPFTIQARLWYQTTLEWFDGDAELEANALAFALAHARERGAFVALRGYLSARKAIQEWMKDLNCTDGELAAAIYDVVPHDDEINKLEAKFKAEFNKLHNVAEDDENTDFTWDGFIDSLIAATGLPRDVWVRQESESKVLDVLQIIIKQRQAEAGDEDTAPDPQDPYMQAVKNLGIAIKEIKRRHTEKKAAGNG